MMDIKDVLKDRRIFASSFQKYIKMLLDEKHPLFHPEMHKHYVSILNHFDSFNNQSILLKDQYISIESQIQDIQSTIKQFGASNIDTQDIEKIKLNLLKKKISLKEKIQKNTLNNYHYSLSLFDKFENFSINILKNETKYPEDLKNNQQKLSQGFPILLDFCYKWEADNLFLSSKINTECRTILNHLQKASKHIHKLRSIPEPFFETKEYKSLSECLPIISKNIDLFTSQKDLWNFLQENSNEYPKILSFISIFEKKDFKSVRSKIRIFSHLEKIDELVKLIKSEVRSIEQIFSVYFYQLDAQKKEILNICLPISDYKAYILKQWIKKDFAIQFNQLKSIEEEYQRQLLKF